MFIYDKKLQYPVKIDNPNPRLAAIIISQYGGPDGELGASLRYLSQRYSMPYPELKANQNFLELQRGLADMETKIQATRQFYNTVVMRLNTQIEQFPSNLVANMFGIKQEKMFEIEESEKVAPKVKF